MYPVCVCNCGDKSLLLPSFFKDCGVSHDNMCGWLFAHPKWYKRVNFLLAGLLVLSVVWTYLR